MQQLFLVALGGALGSVMRYLFGTFANRWVTSMPLGTLSVNLLGSLLIGIILGMLSKDSSNASWITPLFVIGFCGGFTTFSAFSMENMRLMESGQWTLALLYISVSNVLGILLAFCGYRFMLS